MSAYIIPVVMCVIVTAALVKKQPVYELFREGAADGIKLLAQIFPALLCVMTAAAMLRASGAIELLSTAAAPVLDFLGIPAAAAPLILLRPVSGSGALGFLSDILNSCGADSREGRFASIVCASTETTFYCITLYFSASRAKKTLRAVPCAVAGDIAGVLAAACIMRYWKF